MKNFLLQLISDDKGQLSHARFLNLVVGLCAALFCWKLVVMGGFNEYYFALFLAYGSGQQIFNKVLDIILRVKNRETSQVQPPEAK